MARPEGSPVDAAAHLEIRGPIDALEAEVVRRSLAAPEDVGPELVSALRYVLGFARLTVVRNIDGLDVSVHERLAPHRWRVLTALEPHLDGPDPTLWGAVRALPDLVHATRERRARLLQEVPLDRDSLEAEITERQLVVVAGGGGGAGYGYAGAYTLLHRAGLEPQLLAGTSIGGLLSLFRARRRIFDGLPLVEASKRLSWNNVFRVLDTDSRYGIPATLRLYLRSAIGSLFQDSDGRFMTFADAEIPLLIVATGMTMDALKHDLAYYEHFLDDAVRPGQVRLSRMRQLGRLALIFKEFMSQPESLREVVFGTDELTMNADVLDAAGFSAAVTGLIHYDIYRDDQVMRHLLDELYGEYGITRLTEGGLVNNVPARPAYAEVMKGRLGRRNPFVLAMDCFSTESPSMLWFPIQQLVRPNVKANMPYMNLYFPFKRRLNPVNLVPSVDHLVQAMAWTTEELQPHLPFVETMCATLPVLRDR